MSLVDAVADEDEDCVASLLQGNGKLDVNIESDGWSPLLWAAKRGNAQIMAMLLQAGAFIGATDAGGSTALHKCATNGSIECTQLLLEAGASASVRDKMQQTALDVAGIMGQDGIAQLLRKAGARNAKLGITATANDADVQWLASQSKSHRHFAEHKSAGEAEAEGEAVASTKTEAEAVSCTETRGDPGNRRDARESISAAASGDNDAGACAEMQQ